MKYIKTINEIKSSKSDIIYDFSELYINKIADKIGLKLIKKLGKGSYGHAYLTDDNKVLKISSDESEAYNAKKIIGRDTKHLINYYNVKKINLKKGENNILPLYFILMEKVNPLTKEEKEIWNEIQWVFFKLDRDIDISSFPYDKREIVLKFLKNRISMTIEGNEYNISFNDAHRDNLGFRDDETLVYFDIGHSDYITVDNNKVDIEDESFENYYRKVKYVLKKYYKPNTQIEIKGLVDKISNELNVSKRKSYQFLKDEVFFQYRKLLMRNSDYDSIYRRKMLKEDFTIYFTNGFIKDVEIPLNIKIEGVSKQQFKSSFNSKDIWLVYTENY